MYNEIESEFAPKFKDTDLDFKQQFDTAYDRVKHYGNDDVIKNAIKDILRGVLANYSQAKATTKVGRILRWISRIFSSKEN